jgi:hypothetical protein
VTRQSAAQLVGYLEPSPVYAAPDQDANLGWEIEETSDADRRHHWAVLRTGAGPDTRPFDYLADF